MAGFHQLLTICLMEIITIGPECIRGWVYEMQGGQCWQKFQQRNKMTQTVEFRVAMTSTCTKKANILI